MNPNSPNCPNYLSADRVFAYNPPKDFRGI
jgi:hypothetical protein